MIMYFFGSPQRESDFWNHWNSQFHDAQNPSEKQCFIFEHKFHEIWCAQNPSHTSHYCILIVPAGDFLKKQESALPRIMALVFFLAAVRMPVHILDFFNTSQARIVFFIASSPKVWSASKFFTSGIKIATIIFASSKLNENHCRILTVLPRSRFSRLRCAKPKWEHHFFAISRFWPHQNFDSRSGILITCHKVHSRAYGATKIKRAPWPPEYEF